MLVGKGATSSGFEILFKGGRGSFVLNGDCRVYFPRTEFRSVRY